jgi:hypothetical protein
MVPDSHIDYTTAVTETQKGGLRKGSKCPRAEKSSAWCRVLLRRDIGRIKEQRKGKKRTAVDWIQILIV